MKSYLELLEDVMNNGESHDDRTGVGTRSVFGRQWRHDMRDGFPLLTTKKVPLRWVFEELKWFLSGSTNVKDLQAAGVDIWDEWATEEQCAKFGRIDGNLGPIYGELWRDFGACEPLDITRQPGCGFKGCDQIKKLLDDIHGSPNSRRLIVTGWHPHLSTRVALPPCHTLWQVKCHDETTEMSLHLYARSIDIFLGLPFNIASYGMLLEMLCIVTGYTARDLIISFGDLHLYNNHVDQAKEQLSREPHRLPMLLHSTNWQRGNSPLENLLAMQWSDFSLVDYTHHPKISAEVAV